MKRKLRPESWPVYGLMLLLALFLTKSGLSQVTVPPENNGSGGSRAGSVVIGTSEVQSGLVPVSPYYGYSYSQTLYLQSEINTPNQMIKRIGYQYRGATAQLPLELEVYLSHTDATSLPQTVQLATHTKVYDGPVTFDIANDFTLIELDAYYYNNVDNLIVTIIEKLPGWSSPSDVFNVTAVTGSDVLCRYMRNDGTPYDPTSLPDGYPEANRPNIRIEFIDVPTEPAIALVPQALDFGQVELTQSQTRQMIAKNTGGGTLTITGINFNNSAYSVTGASFPVNLTIGQSQIFNIVFQPTQPQLEEGTATFVTQGTVPGNNVANLTGRGLRFGSLRESFENELFPPLGWKVVDLDGDGKTWFRNLTNAPTGQTVPNTGIAAAGLPPYAGNVGQPSYDDWLITPEMIWNNGDLFSFFVKRLANQNGQVWKVGYSTNGSDPSDFVIIDEITDPAMTYTYMSYNLSDYGVANGQSYYMAIQFNGVWSWPGVVDDILGSPVNRFTNDLMVIDMTTGSQMVFQNQEVNFTLNYANYGYTSIAAGDYQLQLCQNVNGTETVLSQVSGLAIEPGIINTQVIPVTFAETGIYNVYAKILWAADMNPVNNFSETMAMEVYAASKEIVNIGTFPINNPQYGYYFPINFTDSWRTTSLSQTMYPISEINTGGIIEKLSYYRSFTENMPQRKIKVWMGETQQSSLNSYVPVSQLQLVFDGKVDFTAGIGRSDIVMSNPFVYTGSGNLVITVYYYDGNSYSSGALFAKMEPEYGINRTMYEAGWGAINPENPTSMGTMIAYPYTTLLLETGEGLGNISGLVQYAANNQPVDGALVEISNPSFPDMVAQTYTNSSGQYNVPFALAGTGLTVTISKFGYNDFVYSNVDLPVNGTVNLGTALLETRPHIALTGTVLKSDTQTPAANAAVTITGPETYNTTTNAAGQYSFASVWGNTDYNIHIQLEGYQDYNGVINVPGAAYTVPPITILEIAPNPNLVTAVEQSGNAVITWYAAGEPFPMEFRYDDGVVTGVLITPGQPDIIGGAAWKYDAEVQSVQWYTFVSENYVSSEMVKITILGLNADGSPNASDVLFTANNIPNNSDWNTYTLSTPVQAPNGFFVGISGYNNYTLLAYDDGVGSPYEWTPRTQWSNGLGAYYPLENATSPPLMGNIFVRAAGLTSGQLPVENLNPTGTFIVKSESQAEGAQLLSCIAVNPPVSTVNPVIDIIIPESQNRSFQNYNIYRKPVTGTDWVMINTAPVTGTTYTDNGFAGLTYGIYHYAVDAEYSNGVYSQKSVSNDIEKDMRITLQLTVNNNTGIQSLSEGAIAVLNKVGSYETYYATADAAGLATFTGVIKGFYNLSVTHIGFLDFAQENLDLDMPENTFDMAISITERIDEPFDAEVILQGQQLGQALFVWNQQPFTDDVEDQTPFAITGFNNWTVIDQDGNPSNYPAGIYYPNIGLPASFMVMNRTMTTPALSEAYWSAHSGDQYFAAFGSTTGNTGNWLISEEQHHTQPYVFSFYARSITETYGLETFMIGYSTTGNATSDFTFTSGNVTTGIYWDEYSYIMPPEAKYVAIKHNYTGFALLVDDLKIGIEHDGAIPGQGFTVYLDDAEVAAGVEETDYQFTNLAPGTYTAGVQGIFHTGTSQIHEVEFTLPSGTEVTFNVSDLGGQPIDNALVEVIFEGEVITSSLTVAGSAILELYPGDYEYLVTKDGYANVSGNVSVGSSTFAVDVMMMMINTVTFEVNDQQGAPLIGANVTIGGNSILTNASGNAVFTLVPMDYQYTITRPGYTGILQQLTVNQDITIPVVMEPMDCEEPLNLTYILNLNNADLSWEAPVIGFEGNWLHWDGDHDNNSVGTGGPVDMQVAQRFVPGDLTAYADHFITRVSFVPREANCTYSVRVWLGGSINSPDMLIVDQVVANPVIGSWNEVMLNTPVYIDTNSELWIGFRCNTVTGHPAGVDAGPAIDGKGNMINLANQGWQTLLQAGATLDYNWSVRGLAEPMGQTVASGMNGGTREYSEPRKVSGYNIYRNGEKVNDEPVTNTYYSDYGLAVGDYTYYVTTLWNDSCESIASNEVDFTVTEIACPAPEQLTANVADGNLVTINWDPEEMTEYRYDDNVRTGQLGFQSGTINGVVGAAHNNPAEISEMSWLLSDAPDGGGPHETVQIYVLGLKADGSPNSNDLLYTESVTNTDGVWNVHQFPATIQAPSGFFLGVAYEGFVGLGVDDGVGAPWVYQNNTHFFSSNYSGGTWSKWESSGFPNNGMIRALGMEGAVKSYASHNGNHTSAGIHTANNQQISVNGTYFLSESNPQTTHSGNILNSDAIDGITNMIPVSNTEPAWINRTPLNFLGYNVYNNGVLLAENLQTNSYEYVENFAAVHCYTATALYDDCGESEHSNEACVTIINTTNNELNQLSVYPNPASAQLQVETSGIEMIGIYSATGRNVFNGRYTDADKVSIDVSQFSNGLYLIKIINRNGELRTVEFIKK